MNASIYDVAKLAGVSISTVSRVINKSGYVSSKTEMKVNRAMEALGFVPSITAQNLAKHRTMLIGLYFPGMHSALFAYSNSYLMEFIRGANEVAMDKGYHLLLINEPNEERAHRSGARVPQYMNFLKQKRIDGLLFGSAPKADAPFLGLIESEAPMVYVGEKMVEDRGLNVYAQLRQNIWQCLDHLYEHRHRDIAVLGLSNQDISPIVAQYREHVQDWQLKVDVRSCEADLDSYMKMLAGMFAGNECPTGLLIMDFSKVQPTINYLNNIGKRVPEDISIVSQEHHFKDGEQCYPAVTCAYVPVYRMATEAARLLFGYLEDKETYNRQIVVTPEIIRRGSVAVRK
ncbi:LacI family DNA-binding transcriptional regulator [Paenibacillus ginsengihumi]|uniref:LacI family DNA-binding transcriptional regulator n=1 Tax=Paenibacillus ginsengihumi TaxID=431596 RepID=UPI00036C5ADF|nr:LacI family DNA-binding transcriptional regulator [Paenibacillus ginsengihumi]